MFGLFCNPPPIPLFVCHFPSTHLFFPLIFITARIFLFQKYTFYSPFFFLASNNTHLIFLQFFTNRFSSTYQMVLHCSVVSRLVSIWPGSFWLFLEEVVSVCQVSTEVSPLISQRLFARVRWSRTMARPLQGGSQSAGSLWCPFGLCCLELSSIKRQSAEYRVSSHQGTVGQLANLPK